MRVIGLTGGIACGKTTVLDHLRRLGAPAVDADSISRALTAPGGAALPAIRKAFGDGVFLPDGTLDRRALGGLVFSDDGKRERLNALLHPMILTQMERELDAIRLQGAPAAMLDVPLLYEAGMEPLADEVWVVSAPKNVQIGRLMRRDGFTKEEALRRIASQMPLEEKCRRADRVIETDKPLEALYREVETLWREIAG